MIIQKRIIFVLLLLAMTLGLYRQVSKEEVVNNKVSNLPQMEMHQAILTSFNPFGENEYIALANQVNREESSNIFSFYDLLLYRLTGNDQSRSVFVNTINAVYDNKIVNFPNQVYVFTVDKDSFIKNALLTDAILEVRKKILESSKPITIMGINFVTHADGFTFCLEDDTYFLQGNVDTQYKF